MSVSQVEDSLHSGKKPERGKAVKKPAAPPKAEELSSIQQGRNSPSPPPPHSTNNDSVGVREKLMLQ